MKKKQLLNKLPTLHHSYIPINNDTIQAIVAEISVFYAHRSGYRIVLHTNNAGAKEFSHIPYDEVIFDLNGIKELPKGIYAFSKFKAMENIPLGDVHIDLDVWIKKPCINTFSDVIVQSLEYWNDGLIRLPIWNMRSRCYTNCKYPEWASRECLQMYNCGVIGFNNNKAKQEFIDTYYKMIEEYAAKGTYIPRAIPDIIIEQQFLYDLCKYYKLDVTLVLPKCTMEEADKIGYQHLIGDCKRAERDKILKVLNYIRKQN